MILKGIVSSVDINKGKAKVIIPEKNVVTSDLTISSNVDEIKPNDNVVIALYDNGSDGIVINNLSRETSGDIS